MRTTFPSTWSLRCLSAGLEGACQALRQGKQAPAAVLLQPLWVCTTCAMSGLPEGLGTAERASETICCTVLPSRKSRWISHSMLGASTGAFTCLAPPWQPDTPGRHQEHGWHVCYSSLAFWGLPAHPSCCFHVVHSRPCTEAPLALVGLTPSRHTQGAPRPKSLCQRSARGVHEQALSIRSVHAPVRWHRSLLPTAQQS